MRAVRRRTPSFRPTDGSWRFNRRRRAILPAWGMAFWFTGSSGRGHRHRCTCCPRTRTKLWFGRAIPEAILLQGLIEMRVPIPVRPQKSSPVPPGRAEASLSPLAVSIVAVAVAVGVIAIYIPSLNFQFVLDDHRFVGD